MIMYSLSQREIKDKRVQKKSRQVTRGRLSSSPSYANQSFSFPRSKQDKPPIPCLFSSPGPLPRELPAQADRANESHELLTKGKTSGPNCWYSVISRRARGGAGWTRACRRTRGHKRSFVLTDSNNAALFFPFPSTRWIIKSIIYIPEVSTGRQWFRVIERTKTEDQGRSLVESLICVTLPVSFTYSEMTDN